jgi:hypothetical protein
VKDPENNRYSSNEDKKGMEWFVKNEFLDRCEFGA